MTVTTAMKRPSYVEVDGKQDKHLDNPRHHFDLEIMLILATEGGVVT